LHNEGLEADMEIMFQDHYVIISRKAILVLPQEQFIEALERGQMWRRQ
jgi:hypothetical protein